MIFQALIESDEQNELILLKNGFCRFHIRKDQQLTIHEFIISKNARGTGIAFKILNILKNKKNITSIVAKCPADLESNKWYKRQNFRLDKIETAKSGRKINVWRLIIENRGILKYERKKS